MLKQIIQLDNELREKVMSVEMASEKTCRKLQADYQDEFKSLGKQIVIELIRIQNGNSAVDIDVFEDNYESFVEIGIEHENEYYPNGYIPIWKVKTEWFQKVGYLTDRIEKDIELIIRSIVTEMLEDEA